jgi:hypothetical protein
MCVSGSLKHTVDPYHEIPLHAYGNLTIPWQNPAIMQIFFAVEYEC